jgi:hypothetical protein
LHALGPLAQVVTANLLRKVFEFLLKMSRFAKEYKLTSIGKVGVQNWAGARYASTAGYQLLATNWVIKKAIVQPTLGPVIDNATGADKQWELPSAF